MNSYEVLPPAVDRKTLLKCESSAVASRIGWERKEQPHSHPGVGGVRLPQPHLLSDQGSREMPALVALTSHWRLETSEEFSLQLQALDLPSIPPSLRSSVPGAAHPNSLPRLLPQVTAT